MASQTDLTNSKTYSYDKLQRLTGAQQTVPAPSAQVESYTYDPAGNRIASHLSTAAIQVDGANRTLDDGINAYSWNIDGQLASRAPKDGGPAINFGYEWVSARNQSRLTSAGSTRFQYDPFGRIVTTIWNDSRGFVNAYNDGPDAIFELRNVFGGPNRQWVRYIHGPGDDQILAMEVYPKGVDPTPGTGTVYYYHPDGEGSVRLLTDATGNIANRYDYDSFGRRLTAVESVAQPYGWKGREFLADIGLVYNRARFYDPVLGRFTTEDPIGYASGDTNLYNFGWNNSKNHRDPSGNSSDYAAALGPSIALAQAFAAAGRVTLFYTSAIGAGAGAGVVINNGNNEARKKVEVDAQVGALACGLSWTFSSLAAATAREEITGATGLCVATTRNITCTASCNVQQIDRNTSCPDRVFGGPTSGKNENDVCRAAKRQATQSAPS